MSFPTMAESPATSASSPPLSAGKDYHAFFCFNSADEEWVEDTIAYLESPETGFQCVNHKRDFIPGKTTIKNIEYFIEKSWKYVLVMSPHFVASEWCSFETDIMVNMSLEQREECIIPVLLKPCTIPKALKTLTYLDASEPDRWREKLVKSIKRSDIPVPLPHNKDSVQDMREEMERVRKNVAKYSNFMDNYMIEKKQLELEKESMERSIHRTVSTLSTHITDELERQKLKRLKDVHSHMDNRIASLVNQYDTVKEILGTANKDLEDKALVKFTRLLDEYDELERRHKETSCTDFTFSNTFIDRLADLMSELHVDVGNLRIINNISQEEILAPSGILPNERDLTLWSLVKCPHFQFDPMTIHAERSILSDGSLSIRSPSQPHPPSERRLNKYWGAVGSTKFTSRGVYFWINSVNVNLEETLEERHLVFEVALSSRGVIDDKHHTGGGTLSLNVHRCAEHARDSLCLVVCIENAWAHHQILHPNKPGHWPTLVLGFLLDTIRNKWTIYDVTKQEEIITVEDIHVGDAEEFTPMFGVYCPNLMSVEMSLITGTDINTSADNNRLFQKLLLKALSWQIV